MSALRAPQSHVRTEADLIGAVRSGDDGAFGELYSRYGGRILGYVGGIVGDHGRAEDIAQDVFISALRGLRADDRTILFKPWIYEIARNACIDEFRRLRRTPELSTSGEQEDESQHETTPPPEVVLERRQQLEDLRGAFGGLSASQHKMLVLRELEGRSYAEIAERMAMSLPMVESALFRARRRLGQEYDEIASGRRCEQVHELIDGGGAEAVRALGLRERRRFARHVAHCQPCRRHARGAGIDESTLRLPGALKKIAALLPLPLVPWLRGRAPLGRGSRTLRSLQRVTHLADPSAAAGAGQAAVAVIAATLAVGGGIADGLHSRAHVGGAWPLTPASMYVAAPRLWPARTLALQTVKRAHSAGSRGRAAAGTTRGHARSSSNGQGGSVSRSGSGHGLVPARGPASPSVPSLPLPGLPVPRAIPVPPVPSLPGVGSILRHTLPKPIIRLLHGLPTKIPIP